MDKTKYVCKNCNYEFTRKSEFKVVRCPYCSKENVIEPKTENFASKMLDEVTSK